MPEEQDQGRQDIAPISRPIGRRELWLRMVGAAVIGGVAGSELTVMRDRYGIRQCLSDLSEALNSLNQLGLQGSTDYALFQASQTALVNGLIDRWVVATDNYMAGLDALKIVSNADAARRILESSLREEAGGIPSLEGVVQSPMMLDEAKGEAMRRISEQARRIRNYFGINPSSETATPFYKEPKT